MGFIQSEIHVLGTRETLLLWDPWSGAAVSLEDGTRETSRHGKLKSGAYINKQRRKRGWRQARYIPGLTES